ncbi:MAG: hypothetical protein JWL81_2446 [Verrucomicrobiales bacterium]|nr:hypothetical protein [Verrucomicrobiales bacterium]
MGSLPHFFKARRPARHGMAMLAPLLVLTAIQPTPAAPPDYTAQIKPLLRQRCYACHGALKQKADLRLDTWQSIVAGGKNGPVLTPGNPDKSPLLQRIVSTDMEDRMPPEHEGEPFTPAQAALIRDWIASHPTAPDPAQDPPESDPATHWSFRPLVRPPIPPADAATAAWAKNPIDFFIARQHRLHGLTPVPEAPRETLIRRLYVDLIGLPPDIATLTENLRDPSPDWYEKTAARLLLDPRHGERWARHWMDIWRYSDWWGLGDQLRNSQKHMWHWRDWIISSLNRNTAYDEMLRQMLAADELYPDDPDKLRATGFLARNFFLFNRNPWMEETVEHVGKSLLALTVNCSKCHDHKYDPIPQTDYYRLRAIFEPYQVRLDLVPGQANPELDGIPRVFDSDPAPPTWRYIRGEETRPDKSTPILPGTPVFLTKSPVPIQSVPLPRTAALPESRTGILETHVDAARQALAAASAAVTVAREKSAASSQISAPTAAADAATLRTAIQALAAAAADLESTRLRADATRAAWENPASLPDKTKAAARATAAASTARARHALTMAEAAAVAAEPAKKPDAARAVETARAALDTALKNEAEPSASGPAFTPLPGARWTPTRFITSLADDPTIPFPKTSSGRRSALAAWITDSQNPLTARVAVNHLWARHFGTPLVASTFDFGRNGTPPTHPDLLDWLAAELIDSHWNLRHIHQLIITSATYRLDSATAGSNNPAAADPDNLWIAHRNPQRLEAEVIRDSLLALSGNLDPATGGPPILPAEQEKSTRRSLYFYHSNNDRNLFLTTFDGAAVKECYRRDSSIVPQQALALTNSPLVNSSAEKIAAALTNFLPDPADPDAFVNRAFIHLLGTAATPENLTACREAMNAWRSEPAANESTARTLLILTLLNHNDFVTLR